MLPSNSGSPLTRQYAGCGGGDGEQDRVGPVHEPAADVDERAQHLGDATGVVVGVEQGVGVGAREPGTDDPRAEHDGGAADDGGRQHDGERMARSTERRPWRLGEPRPQHGGGQEAGSDEGDRQDHPVLVGAERGDEHEQHPTGHEGLTAGSGVEGERVGGEHREGRTDRRQQRPAADVLDRGDGVLELVTDEAEVGPCDVPRLARREDGGERVRVGDPRHRPHQRGGRDDDRQQGVDMEPAHQQ